MATDGPLAAPMRTMRPVVTEGAPGSPSAAATRLAVVVSWPPSSGLACSSRRRATAAGTSWSAACSSAVSTVLAGTAARRWAAVTAARPGRERWPLLVLPQVVSAPGVVMRDHRREAFGVGGGQPVTGEPLVHDLRQAAAPKQRTAQVQLRQAERVGGEQHLVERRDLQRLSDQLQGAQAAVRDGRAGIEPYMRVDVRQVPRLPVIGVAVQQHDLRAHGLHRLDEPGHPGRVATVQHDVGVAEPDMELQRQAEINPGPQNVPEQDRVIETGLPILRASAQPVPRGASDIAGRGAFWIEIETKAVSHDGLEPDRRLGRPRERAGVSKSEASRADVTAGELLGYRFQPDNLPGRLARDLRHLLHGQQLTATVAGVDEIAADAGCA